MGFYKFEGKCQEVLQLLNKLFLTDRSSTSYLENRSRRTEVSSEVFTVVPNQQGKECKKRVYCMMYIWHTSLRKYLDDVRKCWKD